MLRELFTFLARLRTGAIAPSHRRYELRIDEIRQREAALQPLSESSLRSQFMALRGSVDRAASRAGIRVFDEAVIRGLALASEAASRAIGQRPFDVQLLAALAMHDHKLVEMQTGEGKTLAAVLPVSLRARAGRGAHVLTYNDYLAERDARWMGPVYRLLGLTVGHVVQGMPESERRAAYACDVTYVTAKEAGFDFLRDQLQHDRRQHVQRGHHFAVVDEADSILIDEARVPLVIAGSTDEAVEDLTRLAALVRQLRAGVDYKTDRGWRNVSFNSAGLDRLQRELRCGELHSDRNVDLLIRLNLALQAEVLLRRDVDYLVRDDQILLIDEWTGRIAENRRWPYGLQAAIEAKEHVTVRPRGAILESITLHKFLSQYETIAGMTGTAQEAAEELHDAHQLTVVVIPPNRPCIRVDHPDRVFATKLDQHAAVAREIAEAHRTGRPVLVGTGSVEESERLASLLARSHIPCRVLNARNDHEEAAVIAEAGSVGAVTISTNMAGRGTDIRLGGSDERERERVVQLGGLLLIGTNRHESRRIDNQLRGRAGRQGDPGETRFLISVEDDLLRRHGLRELLDPTSSDTTGPEWESRAVGRTIQHVQRVIEGECFEIRRTLRKYSICLEQHRRLLQERRRPLLLGQDGPAPASVVLRNRDPELFEQLVAQFGPEVVDGVEQQVTLACLDRAWSDHLASVADVRLGIHLLSMSGYSALDEFNRRINQEFRELCERIDHDVLQAIREARSANRITAQGIDLEQVGLLRPSSTWTYMINDNPLGDMLDRLTRGIQRVLGLRRSRGGQHKQHSR